MGRQHWTDSVSAKGREGRGFDSACETNFLFFKNDLNLSAWKILWITRPENVLRVLVWLASAKPPRLRNITHTRKISFSGLVIQITIIVKIKEPVINEVT
jgi:hypothetical protein